MAIYRPGLTPSHAHYLQDNSAHEHCKENSHYVMLCVNSYNNTRDESLDYNDRLDSTAATRFDGNRKFHKKIGMRPSTLRRNLTSIRYASILKCLFLLLN